MQTMKKQFGFSMVELMVVLAISAILLGLAAPSFTTLVKKSNVTSAVNTFLADARFARSEAVRLGTTVTMCRSTNSETGNTTGPTCASGDSWDSGGIIFMDQDRDGDRDYDADASLDDRVLRRQGPISSIDIKDQGGTTKIKFAPTGRLVNASSAVTLKFGGSYDVSLERSVCVNVGGRARVETSDEAC